MSLKNNPNQQSEFMREMENVKPLKNNRFNIKAQIKKKPAFFNQRQEPHEIPDQLSDEWESTPVGYEESIKFSRDGIGYKQMHQLKTGNMIIEDHLDLHGLSIPQARKLIVEFLHFSQRTGARCVKIVHGKGYKAAQHYPVIKNKVNSWLRQHPDVLAFHSAIPKDGGTGAVYVLLKSLHD